MRAGYSIPPASSRGKHLPESEPSVTGETEALGLRPGGGATLIKRTFELPALVRPGPVRRRGMDLVLDKTRVALGERSLRQIFPRGGEWLELQLVEPACRAA